MIDPLDLQHCTDAIKHGSRSFHAASKLLPGRVRDPALVLYAFCRIADDAVDLDTRKQDAVCRLRDRLDLCYAGRPRDTPVDRAFAQLVDEFAMPRALPDALLDGLAWDADGRRYATLTELRDYSARVAASVGVMMCVLMDVRDRHTVARACDLGVAMQLTNVARDVGEDAAAGRLYLPLDWLSQGGIDPEQFLLRPEFSPALARTVGALLSAAEDLYIRAESGIGDLPVACRPGIFAARYIYSGIGGQLAKSGHDSVHGRARTSRGQKVGWLAISCLRAAVMSVTPRSSIVYAEPLAETRFLVDAAAAGPSAAGHWSDTICNTLAGLKSRDRERHSGLSPGPVSASSTT